MEADDDYEPNPDLLRRMELILPDEHFFAFRLDDDEDDVDPREYAQIDSLLKIAKENGAFSIQ